MKRFFLDNPAKTKGDKIANVGLAFSFLIFWASLVTIFFHKVFGMPLGEVSPVTASFITACIIAPLWEELYYRYAPITIARALGEKTIIPAVVISSVMFGFAHGNTLYNLFMQGVMGIVFSWVYIKNGFSYKSSVLLHFLWNLFVLFIAPTFG